MDRDAHLAALEAELVYAKAARRRAEARITSIEAELGRVRGGAPETAVVPEPPERAVPERPKKPS